MNETITRTRRLFSSRTRNAVLTFHIAVSVGLLGDSAGFLAVAVRAARADDPAAVIEMMQVLNMFATVFGIPLSFAALISGILLGFGTKWGVLRYPWVMAKLTLIVSVMAVGGAVIGPALNTMLAGGTGESPQLIAAAAYDVVALAVATGLSVFKPGRRLR
jgi:Predicted integral membrane protein (DUF2269)